LKLSGSYEIPRIGVTLAGVFKIQTGMPYARFVTAFGDIDEVAFNQGSIQFYAEPRGSRRLDTLRVLDLRLSKSFDLGRRHRLELMADVFNVFNRERAHDAERQHREGVPEPLDILGPRALRFGARWRSRARRGPDV